MHSSSRRSFLPIILTLSLDSLLCSTLAAQERRIAGAINESHLAVTHGNVNPQARADNDKGHVDPLLALHVAISFRQSDAQQADLAELLRRQQDPNSPVFHEWLTPEQYADRFGLSQGDIDTTVNWLQSNGFSITRISRGRDLITFAGTASQVEAAFKTPIHRYLVHGEGHYANLGEPWVPDVIAPVVQGFLGLDDFRPRHPKAELTP